MKRLASIFLITSILLMFCSCESIDNMDISRIDTLLRNEPSLSKIDNLIKMPINPNEDNGEYLLLASDFDNIDTAVYSFKFCNGKIENIKEIEKLYGNIVNYKTLKINDSIFWQFDISNHQGNGDSYFYSLDDDNVVFEIPCTVDWHFEGANGLEYLKTRNFNTSNLKFDNKSKIYPYSIVYADKKLNSYIKDINNDGYDDIVFYGSSLLIEDVPDNDYSNVIPTQMVSIERKFYFDIESKIFNEKD